MAAWSLILPNSLHFQPGIWGPRGGDWHGQLLRSTLGAAYLEEALDSCHVQFCFPLYRVPPLLLLVSQTSCAKVGLSH